MEQGSRPVDVICVCSADGQIRPLRFRMEDEQRQLFRVDIDEVVSTKQICYVGVEAMVFMCRATVWGKCWLFELKYSFRSHTWCLLRRLY